MKNIYISTILFVIPFLANAQSQLDNASFENWTPGLIEPDNWIIEESNQHQAYKSIDACDSSFSVLLTDSIFNSTTLSQGKQFNIAPCPIGISFCYKYKSTPNDIASFYAILTYGNTEQSIVTKYFNDDVSVWTQETLLFADFTEFVDNFYEVDVKLNVHNFIHVSTDYSQLQIDNVGLIYGPTGINHLDEEAKIHLYPNPTANELNITGTSGPSTIKLVDLLGNLVLEKQITSNCSIDVSYLAQGLYSVWIENGKNAWVEKIAIVH